MKHALKSILNLRVIVATIVGVGVLVVLILAAGPQQALGLITHFHLTYLIAFFVLAVGYEVVRWAQWH